jgi:hypothetical protein
VVSIAVCLCLDCVREPLEPSWTFGRERVNQNEERHDRLGGIGHDAHGTLKPRIRKTEAPHGQSTR